jgi:hypothetical protein
MKELVPALWDDLDRVEKDEKIPADHTRFLGWEGEWYELDMTTEHTAEIETFLARYIKAGMKGGEPPQARKTRFGGAIAEANRENLKKAAWADAHGFTYTLRKAGGFYFPVATERAYQEAQRGTRGD